MKHFAFVLISFFIFGTNLNAADQVQLEVIHLRWQPVDYALQYEIIVEQKINETTYAVVLDEIKRDGTEIDCRLPAGIYRYQVIVYDVFERGAVQSDWLEFEVKQRPATKQPKEKTEEKINDEIKKSNLEVTASFEYSPIFPFITGITDETIIGVFQPASVQFRISVIPLKTRAGNFGFEFSPEVSLFQAGIDTFFIHSVIFGFDLNALYQAPLNKSMAINIRLGGGVAIFYNFYFKQKADNSISTPVNILSPLAAGALSFQYNFNKSLYIDAGAQYRLMFFVNSLFHFVSPFASIGGRF